MKKIIPPDEFLAQRFLKHLPKEELRSSFRNELQWLKEYADHVSQTEAENFSKVISKVNYLIRKCLKKDQKEIDAFLATYTKLNSEDVLVLNADKIISE